MMFLRFLSLRTQFLSRRLYTTSPRPKNPRASRKDPGEYFETRRSPGWWRRQDFDDKMTYVVSSQLTLIGN